MIRLRRQLAEPRLEVMPLIDVVFLLLTFFIYSLVLMVRANMLPITLPELASGEPAEPVTPIVVLIDRAGNLYLDAEPVAGVDEAILQLRILRDERPKDPVVVAADQDGDADRLPTFLQLIDRLADPASGVGDFSIMGRPTAAP